MTIEHPGLITIKQKTYFDLEYLKVGDTLWDFGLGDGVIIEIDTESNYPIRVRFNYMREWNFTLNGFLHNFKNQTLFYKKFDFIPPSRPKRIMKKKDVYHNIVWLKAPECNGPIYPSRNEPFKHNHYLYKPPMTMTLEWEEDENGV